MPRFNLPKKIFVVALILIVLIFVIRFTGYDRRSLTPIETVLREVMAPLQSGVMKVSRTFSNITHSIASYNKLQEENKYLREKIRELSLENTRLEEFRQENVRLKLLLDMKENLQGLWEIEPARVIARDYNNWYNTVIINKGKKDGINKDMAVINYQGLVGRVIKVTPNTSEVLLIIDSESAVGALVQATRVPGVVEAATTGTEKLQLVHIPHDAPIPDDGVVVTSGLGGIFPKGLRIGYIKEITVAPNGLVKKALIRPFVDFDCLEEVLVIKRSP